MTRQSWYVATRVPRRNRLATYLHVESAAHARASSVKMDWMRCLISTRIAAAVRRPILTRLCPMDSLQAKSWRRFKRERLRGWLFLAPDSAPQPFSREGGQAVSRANQAFWKCRVSDSNELTNGALKHGPCRSLFSNETSADDLRREAPCLPLRGGDTEVRLGG